MRKVQKRRLMIMLAQIPESKIYMKHAKHEANEGRIIDNTADLHNILEQMGSPQHIAGDRENGEPRPELAEEPERSHSKRKKTGKGVSNYGDK